MWVGQAVEDLQSGMPAFPAFSSLPASPLFAHFGEEVEKMECSGGASAWPFSIPVCNAQAWPVVVGRGAHLWKAWPPACLLLFSCLY